MTNIERAREVRAMLKMSAAGITDDQQALKVKSLYDEWSDLPDGTSLAIRTKVNHKGNLYKVINEHEKQSDWEPGTETASLFEVIDETHAGTQEDPIPWVSGMQCYKDKYYSYNDILYKCIRDSGQGLNYTPDQLIDNYFEIA